MRIATLRSKVVVLLGAALALSLAAAEVAGARKPPRGPRALTNPFPLDTCGDCRSVRARVAGSPNGDFLAGWEAVSDFRAFRRSFDANGNGGEVVRLGDGRQAKLAGGGPDGDLFRVGWLHPGQIWWQRLDTAGVLVGSPERVNIGGSPGLDDHDASLVMDREGRALFVWDSLSGPSQPTRIAAQLHAPGGMRVAPPTTVATTWGVTEPVGCLRPDGGGGVAWAQFDGVPGPDLLPWRTGFRRLGPGGEVLGEVEVVGSPGIPSAGFGHALACAGDGSFAVAWHEAAPRFGLDVFWQRFDADGNRRGGPALVNPFRPGDQTRPALLVEPGGAFFAVWASLDRGRSVLVGRRFALDGRALSGELLLHAAARGQVAQAPQVATLGTTGRFVLAWSEGQRLFAKIFHY